MRKKDLEDRLNRSRSRNRKNTDLFEYNCGGLSLETYNWYKPYEENTYNPYQEMNEMLSRGYTREEIQEVVLKYFTDFILNDFPELQIINYEQVKKINDSIIALRIYIKTDREGDSNDYQNNDYYNDNNDDNDDNRNGWIEDYDFHFRLRENGVWIEKHGSCDIEEVEDYSEDPWIDSYNYNGPIVYFKKK